MRTLRVLKHPATITSIFLLLANGHWFKASFPSWWTGKLSDFAGLFFFPSLIAPLFALFLLTLDPADLIARLVLVPAWGPLLLWAFGLFRSMNLQWALRSCSQLLS